MTEVVVPTVVRARPDALQSSRIDPATAVYDGVLTALGRARAELVDCDMTGAAVSIAAPSVRWSGAVANVSGADQKNVEATVLRGLAAAINDGGLSGVPTAEERRTTPRLDLAWFETEEQAYGYVVGKFGDASPRGSSLVGTYAMWMGDRLPHVFFVDSGPASLVMRHYPLAAARQAGSRIVPLEGNVPVFEPGKRYVIEARGEPGVGDLYPGRAIEEGGDRAIRLVLDRDLHEHLIGRRLRIEAASQPYYETTVRALGRREEGVAPWAFVWGPSALPRHPLEAEPSWMWWWMGWLDVRPENIRTNGLVRRALQALEDTGEREHFNPLFIEHYLAEFYARFLQQVGLAMLDESRANMEATQSSMEADRERWLQRLGTLVRWSGAPARALRDVAHRSELEERLRLARAGIRPEGGVADDPADLERRLAAARAISPPGSYWERSQGTGAGGTVAPEELALLGTLQAVADVEPVLVLLRMRSGTEVRSLEDALSWAADAGSEETLDHIREQLGVLLHWNRQGYDNLLIDPEAALDLTPVQQEGKVQLNGWIVANPLFRKVVHEASGESMAKWMGLAGIVIGLTLVFPPLGAAAGLAVSLYAAEKSLVHAQRMMLFRHVRLAQQGFTPLATEEEADAAVEQAVIDVAFAIVDLFGVAKAAAALEAEARIARAEARAAQLALAEAAGESLLRTLDRQLLAWRRLGLWPAEVATELRARVLAQAQNLGFREVASAIEPILVDVQAQIVRRLEAQAQTIPGRLRAALDTGLPAEQIGDWIRREVTSPKVIVERLMRDDEFLRQSVATAMGRRLRGEAAPALVERMLSLPAAAELEAIRRDLGGLADVVSPERAYRLAVAADVPAGVMVQRLRALVMGSPAPEARLATLEAVLLGREDAFAVLRALDRVPAEEVLPVLRRELLDVTLSGGYDELFGALRRSPSAAQTVAAFAERDRTGAYQLLREIRVGDTTKIERWTGEATGWIEVPEIPRAAPRLREPSWVKRITTQTNVERIGATATALTQRESGRALLALIRQDARTADAVLLGLAHWEGAFGREIAEQEIRSLDHFLDVGGSPDVLGELLIALDKRAWKAPDVRDLVNLFGTLDPRQARGVGVVFHEMRGGRQAGEALMNMYNNLDAGPMADVLGRLADLSEVEGLRGPIGYLTRPPVYARGTSQGVNLAALAQLDVVRDLLAEFPGRRIAFEAPEFKPGGQLVREIDVRVKSIVFGTTELDVEIKEISELYWIDQGHARKQFARDLVRSLDRSAGQISLRDIRWLINQREFARQGMATEDLRAALHEAFANALAEPELKAYTAARFTGSAEAEARFLADLRRYIDRHFDEIVRLF